MPPFAHRLTDEGFDSRRYVIKRRSSTFGYHDTPAVNDAMSFTLPPFPNMYSRIVSFGSKTWELWSPNSALEAFYPGVRDPGFEVKMEREEKNRRFDGHLGRFDYTKWPQYYDSRRPWIGFIRRDRASSSRVEHIPLYLAWESLPPSNGSYDLGRLDTAFLLQLTTRNIELEATMSSYAEVANVVPAYWEDRPLQPTENDVKELQGVLHFAAAVDSVAAVQRGLKLKSAWVKAMKAVLKARKGAVYTGWLPQIPLASQEFVGVWINGAKEEEATWLLNHKVPCFIIHEIPTSELYRFKEEYKYPDFVVKTDAEFLLKERNGFEHLAFKTFTSGNDTPDQGGIPRVSLVLRAEDRGRSDPLMQGWLGSQHAALEETPEVIMKPVTDLRSSLVVPIIASVGRSSSTAPEPETRRLAADRVEWLVPPPVMAVSEGKWTMWEEWVADHEDMFFRRVFARPQGCEELYYDRKERRQIYVVERMTIPPGVVSDINVYGVPAPTARFVDVTDNKITKEYVASHWLYKIHRPAKGTTGLSAPVPDPKDLPLNSSLRKSDKLPASTVVPETIPTSTPASPPAAPVASTSIPCKPIPTEPRAHRQLEGSKIARSESQLLGRRSRTPVEGKETEEPGPEQLAKKPRTKEGLTNPGTEDVADNSITKSIDPPAMITNSSKSAPKASFVAALPGNSTDSRFLCFEGLTATWKECCSWFYGVAVSSHIVWISRMFRTVMDSKQLVWVELGSNEDACKLRGFLTHRTMPDNSLVVSHFVSEATFQASTRNYTNKWVRPPPPVSAPQDDPMEGSSRPPLEERLTAPGSPSTKPDSPARDVTLLHRTGVTLEERVEGVQPKRHFRGGVRHKKKNKPKRD